MGKKKVLSEKDLREMVLPSKNDVLGVVQKMLGFDRVMVKCQDGYTRVCRIRGKMKRRTWIRGGRHCPSEPLGLPERGAWRDLLEVHSEPGRRAQAERNTENRVG